MNPGFAFAAILPVFFLFPAGTAHAAEGASHDRPPTTPRATFCNPLNLDYGWSAKGYRHAADPVIVLFQDRYYLFTTWDVPGCRVSDNLVDWRYVPFADDALPWMTGDGRGYCAPAVAVHGDWLYFINMQPRKSDKTCTVMRSCDPLSGRWEKCGEVRKVGDPDLYFDDDGKVYLYSGLGSPTRCFELDPKTFTEIPGTDRQLRPAIPSVAEFFGGYERGRREIFAETDTAAFLGKFKIMPCQEAAWMTKHNGRYYLQYATPGTVSQWYCDTVMEGDSPVGPFRHVDYAPVSLKAGGFMGSAGHSCVFQDKHGNWWRVTTMWIGVHDLFERRVGLFPVRFDAQGRMYTETALGDYPQIMPAAPRESRQSPLAGWWVLSAGKKCTASSSLEGHPPDAAADENVRTWWSAQTGNAGEWFELDLGKSCRVHAVQVNFAEQECHSPALRLADDYHQYQLLTSADDQQWRPLIDKNANKIAVPHDYVAVPESLPVRFLRVANVRMPAGGKFALRDLRVFGHGGGTPPAKPAGLEVQRHRDDDRNVSLTWTPAAGAEGYLIRYGIAPDKLWQCVQVQGGSKKELTLHTLNRGVVYHFRVDAFNDSGLTPGDCGPPVTGRAAGQSE